MLIWEKKKIGFANVFFNSANWAIFLNFSTGGMKQHIRDKINFLSRKSELIHNHGISFSS